MSLKQKWMGWIERIVLMLLFGLFFCHAFGTSLDSQSNKTACNIWLSGGFQADFHKGQQPMPVDVNTYLKYRLTFYNVKTFALGFNVGLNFEGKYDKFNHLPSNINTADIEYGITLDKYFKSNSRLACGADLFRYNRRNFENRGGVKNTAWNSDYGASVFTSYKIIERKHAIAVGCGFRIIRFQFINGAISNPEIAIESDFKLFLVVYK
jgi:hypothetical protein